MAKRTLTGTTLDTIVSLAKRRGFVFQSSEIYGGLSSVWDYGPVGAELKRNVKDAWWKSMVRERDDVVGIEASILMHPDVWVASGHLDNFTDPLVECKDCNKRFRQDQLEGEVCPNCGGAFGEPRQFNLMFKTFMGPVEDDAATVYLRPETAQAMFVNFENVQTTSRKKIPFGIAQIGKSFRNEITPGNFTFRTREFEQMEMEFFCEPGTDDKWHEYWMNFSMEWFKKYGIRGDKLLLRVHEADELPHYSKASADIEYKFPWGWGELETISNRTDFDLKAHSAKSGKDLSYFDDQKKERYVPFVVEPAMGADRSALAFLLDAYDEEGEGKEMRVVLRFHPDIAPFQVAVLPLSKKDTLNSTAQRVHDLLRPHFNTQYDDTQSIGRRYRRQDEIGTPLCVTVDFDTLDDDAVTIRNRDTMEQVRVPIENLEAAIRNQLNEMRADSQG
ncbi:MAG: glycine--tRNA ligase [Dehalococcoidia bacterium]|nr:glycine--tRNA ligase [Dehalococcoidia bacterium]